MTKPCCLIDIGNSTCLISRYEFGEMKDVFRIATKELLDLGELPDALMGFDRYVVGSVVPACDAFFPVEKTFFVTAESIPKLAVNIHYPSEVGADRVLNALGAFEHYGGPCIIVDSGTAVTVCYVDEHAVYQGGTIFPGMRIASQALADYTAKIPLIYVEERTDILGKSTRESVQNGLYFGFMHLINGFISHYRALYPKAKVIGTGSGLTVLGSNLDIDIFDSELILKGLAVCADFQEAR